MRESLGRVARATLHRSQSTRFKSQVSAFRENGEVQTRVSRCFVYYEYLSECYLRIYSRLCAAQNICRQSYVLQSIAYLEQKKKDLISS